MAKRQVFYSFHYYKDSWRAAQVKNMGMVEGNTPVSANEWEEVKKKVILLLRIGYRIQWLGALVWLC